MKRFVLLLVVTLMLGSVAEAQYVRPRHKPVNPLPRDANKQSFHSGDYEGTLVIPAVLKPIAATRGGEVPNAFLGYSLAQLLRQFPGIQMVEQKAERVVYKTPDDVIFELYNNRVVEMRGEVKGQALSPDERLFVSIANQLEETAFERATGDKQFWQYFYPKFIFSMRYNYDNDIYTIRYKYKPSDERFGELNERPEAE